jgi:hypothetical protein
MDDIIDEISYDPHGWDRIIIGRDSTDGVEELRRQHEETRSRTVDNDIFFRHRHSQRRNYPLGR